MISRINQKTLVALLFIFAVVTSFNLTKAVHIDDTAYLEFAQQILKDPLHPYSGTINWYDTQMQNSSTYAPLLLPYLFAFSIAIFAESEIIFHLIISIFSFIGIVSFYLLVKHFVKKYYFLLTAIFAISPFFIPSQNLMTDIPAVSLWLAFFALIICSAEEKKSSKYLVLAAFVIGAASLIKYASLILIPLLLVFMLFKKEWVKLWIILIPIFILVFWSVFNYYDYGGIHLLSSPKGEVNLLAVSKRILLWMIALGSVTPFSIIFIPQLLKNKLGSIYVVFCLLAAHLISLRFWRVLGETALYYYLREYFLANGLLLFGLVLIIICRNIWQRRKQLFEKENIAELMVSGWTIGGFLYLVIFVPFMAVRHLIFIIPAIILILGNKYKDIISYYFWLAGLTVTVILAVILGVSDWIYADVYRRGAKQIEQMIAAEQIKKGTRTAVWFGGHWGWQWYAKKAGMKQYDTWNSIFEDGDYLVMPTVEKQYINPFHTLYLQPVGKITVSADLFTYFRLMTNYPWFPTGYYAMSGPEHLPWAFSKLPIEEFNIYQYFNPSERQT